jgi:cytochrome c oxidase assembly protein subunit 15
VGSNPAAPTNPPLDGRARETMTTVDKPQTSRAAALWLTAVAAVILAMVVVGGATRATGSGLSITQWQPVSGVVPPLTHAAWERMFALYRATPQYRLVNAGMSLTQFQHIFWWEWTHRLLGRVLGVVFFAPFFLLLVLRRLPRRLIIRCLVLFALGGLQGFVGWRMVQSGLAGRTSVAPEWLALHQGTALVLLMAILWTALEAWRGPPQAGQGRAAWRWAGAAFLVSVYLQCLLGALVAGNHAGLVDADWPLMAGRIFPNDYWQGSLWLTLIRGQAAVQFNHRVWAYLLLVAGQAIALATLRRDTAPLRPLAMAIAGLLIVQVALGVATLLLTVPFALALLHQFTAVSLLAAATAFAWKTRRISRVL